MTKTTREACVCCVFIIFAYVVCLLLSYLHGYVSYLHEIRTHAWYKFPVRDRIRQANALIKGGCPKSMRMIRLGI